MFFIKRALVLPRRSVCVLKWSKLAYSTNIPIEDLDLEFKGLDGISKCTIQSIEGPEPVYLKLKENMYKSFHYENKFTFKLGGVLPEIKLAYETWGHLNEKKDNAILLFTGLSANSHAKRNANNLQPGWWEDFIGEKMAIDTEKFYVICVNHLGSCFGSSGPYSISPITKKPYATTFPIITVDDMVKAQFLLLDHLGVDRLHASVGSSLGGMCSLLSGLKYPLRVSKVIAISTCARAEPSSIAMRYLQRKAIMLDPKWNNGFYYDQKEHPINGLRLAREIATVTYRSGPEWKERFGRKKMSDTEPITLCPSFEIENYLNHQGETFSTKYDPNSLLYLSKAMDLFDLAEGCDSMVDALQHLKCPVLIMGSQTDILFPVKQQRDLSKWIKEAGNSQVSYFEMDSLYGHDTFLLNLNDVGTALKGFLETKLNKTGEISKSKKK
ncbi:unnamed protein product [Brachionus calyciflorus]|uniref:AB hydrolase-1 domain-containing protein n=1 Tax=Brachionus calyciflorus TaxID=104777 RepID=A0A814E296_9BILA|nr:unnamed protein product [Brachionus calyciflorus]